MRGNVPLQVTYFCGQVLHSCTVLPNRTLEVSAPVSCRRSISVCTRWKFSSPWVTHVRLISMSEQSSALRFCLRKYQLIQSFCSSENMWSYVLVSAGHFWSVGYSYVLDRSESAARRVVVRVPIRRLAVLKSFLDIPQFLQQTPGYCLKPATT